MTSKRKGAFGIGVTIIAVFIIIPALYNSGRKEDSKEMDAWYMAQHFVKEKLKSPPSAEFPRWDPKMSIVESKGGSIYVVGSYVDARNSLGAEIRTSYIATLRYDGNDKWSLVDVQFSEP